MNLADKLHHLATYFLVYQLILYCLLRVMVYQLMLYCPPRDVSNQAALPYELQAINSKDTDLTDGHFLFQSWPYHSTSTPHAVITLFIVNFGNTYKRATGNQAALSHGPRAIKLYHSSRTTSNQAHRYCKKLDMKKNGRSRSSSFPVISLVL